MGTFSHPIEVFSADGSRSVTVDALVDTAAAYTRLPAPLLRQLGARPSRRSQSRLPDGSWVAEEIGEVRVRLQGVELTTIAVFAAADRPARLGAYTLTGALLAVDPEGQRLVPTLARRPSRREVAAA